MIPTGARTDVALLQPDVPVTDWGDEAAKHVQRILVAVVAVVVAAAAAAAAAADVHRKVSVLRGGTKPLLRIRQNVVALPPCYYRLCSPGGIQQPHLSPH